MDRKDLDPDAVLDYVFDWSEWLALTADGDVISEASAVADSANVTVGPHPVTHTSATVTVWLSQGVAGKQAIVTCHVKTAAGREDDWPLQVIVKN